MALSLELDGLFSCESSCKVMVGQVAVDAVCTTRQQSHSDYDGGLIETWELLLKHSQFPDLYVGEELEVDTIPWEIEEVSQSAGVARVKLIRNLG